ncbi:hypothetical protein HRbin41_00964 [bacterium HR41]|nr:hypothetical protein HRbin41_00964 [bacterium HR41]
MARETAVDEARCRVDEQTEASERTLTFQAGDEVVGERHPLERLSEDEFARVEDERLVTVHLDQFGQVVHRRAHVDVGVAGVVEDAEATIDANVDARRLDHRLVERFDHYPSRRDLGANRAVAEDHRRECTGATRAR